MLVDIAVTGGRVVAIASGLPVDAADVQPNARLVAPGLVDTHIHLDKSCILNRCRSVAGTLQEAIAEAAAAKRLHRPHLGPRLPRAGGGHPRRCHAHAHDVEVDPRIGLQGFRAVRRLAGGSGARTRTGHRYRDLRVYPKRIY
ncbi:MAG TPA: hypothetical protein VFR73_04875 [Hyphomicrobiaceae bacterium]|nr:hypothetical protein [Hyphomicrobiaceae bacterium]